jgi:hypothetical protein
VAEFGDQALGHAPGVALTIQTRTKADHHAYKTLDQIFFAVLSQIDHFNLAILDLTAIEPTESSTAGNTNLPVINT